MSTVSTVVPDSPFPGSPGTYVLRLEVLEPGQCVIGRYGAVELDAGAYYYVGSALGQGGLRSRLGRHTRPLSRCRWHVDYLRRHGSTVAALFVEDSYRYEHAWAAALGRLPGMRIPVPGFGASDCRCPSHLFHARLDMGMRTLRNRLAPLSEVSPERIRIWEAAASGATDSGTGGW